MPTKKTTPKEDLDDLIGGEKTETFVCPEGEEKYFHVQVEKEAFNPLTGKKLSRPYVITLSPKEYKIFAQHTNGLGFTKVKVLHEAE